MTIDTMIYIILALSGIATVSLYLNIFCAIKLHNYIEYNHKIKDCDNAVEELHIENMNLIEKIDKLKKQVYQGSIQTRPPLSQYTEEYVLDKDRIEQLLKTQNDATHRKIKEVAYTHNIKTQSDE
tara:strand:+ start:237 stop:611 length:375 start_codon:yes stop_codon:yes gene_type:complete